MSEPGTPVVIPAEMLPTIIRWGRVAERLQQHLAYHDDRGAETELRGARAALGLMFAAVLREHGVL